MAQDRLTSFLRRTTSTPTLTLFRFTNFELYSRCVSLCPHASAARCGGEPRALTTVSHSNNLAVAIPGTAVFLGVVAYFAMMKSDVAQLERERGKSEAKQGR
jgi:hypothetical protein